MAVSGGESGHQCIPEVVLGLGIQRQAASNHGDAEAGDPPEPGLQQPAGAHLLLLAVPAAAAPAAGHPRLRETAQVASPHHSVAAH